MKARTCFLAATGRNLSTALLAIVPACALATADGTSSVGGSYELTAQVVAAGGAPLTGANGWSIDVTIGQNNAARLSGANGYSAGTGFWEAAGRGGASDRIFQGSFEPSAP